MIYLYGIREPQVRLPRCEGLDDAPLEQLDREGVAAMYSSHSTLAFRPTPQALWRHELIVERVMEDGPMLPARFGTTFAGVHDLSTVLAEAAPRLQAQLDRVRGCVELAVRVGVPSGPRAEPRDGREYLHAKLLRRRERESLAQRTLEPLMEFAADCRRHDRSLDAGVITASYLVRKHEVGQFADEVRLLQRQGGELQLSCTGPWAPYSFTDEGSS